MDDPGDALARSRTLAQDQAGNVGQSLAYLQIAIMLSSVQRPLHSEAPRPRPSVVSLVSFPPPKVRMKMKSSLPQL